MEGLGRVFNVIAVASGVRIPMHDADGIAFVCYEDGGATDLTIDESNAASGGTTQNLATVTRFFTSNGVGGAWSLQTQSAAALVEPSDDTAQDCAVIHVSADELSDGFDYIECTSDGGSVVAILYDLAVQRAPENLPALV